MTQQFKEWTAYILKIDPSNFKIYSPLKFVQHLLSNFELTKSERKQRYLNSEFII